MADGDVIEYLVAHGAYVEAARIAADRGELRRAVQLYERVWRFADALPLAVELGDRGLAVRLALDANLPARAIEIADAAAAPEELTAVADAFAARGRPFEAARASERGGDWRRAAGLYRRSGAPLEEARVLARAGEVREAGLIYERLIGHGAAAGGDGAAGGEAGAARLELGRLLERLGRHEEAVRHLQAAARLASLRATAWRALCAPLLALGYRGAAIELVARLRQDDAGLPGTPEEMAALDEGQAAVTASSVPGSDGAAGSAAPAPMLVRRFQVRRLLGGGATGRVFEAVDTLLGSAVALKLLSIGGGAAAGGPSDPERQAYLRFAREADAAGRLRHPNIVALYDAQPGAGLFVFELMAGGTLAERLATTGPLAPAAGRRLALDVLAALGAAHERGIVHRDVKPANVFFDAAGNAKLGDFGAAHLADFGQTQTGGFLGTLAYMSPEQITGAAIGFAADLYALGVTLYEAMAGRPPFLGPDLVAQHLGDHPPPPSSLRRALSAAHDQVLLRALSKAPADRFASAADMADAIAARWPTENASAEPDEPAGEAQGPLGNAAVVGAHDDAAGEELWRNGDRRVVRRHDRRSARDVLVEEHTVALTDDELAELRRVAAAGGPHTQRVLRLSDDRTQIWYEAIAGDPLPLEAMTADERAQVSAARASLPAGAARGFVRTPGGPVLLVVPLLSS
jgi:serine/threonine-protein kinase